MKKAFTKKARTVYFLFGIGLLIGLAVLVIALPDTGQTQEEVTSNIARYRERVKSGYYEGYEVKPRRRQRDRVKSPSAMRSPFPFGIIGPEVRIRARLADAHVGIKFYEAHTCIECHQKQARNIHSDRAGIGCRQCHGSEPIAAINHYYSAMNSIRRHAYVCAKCHEGANAAFAGFYVHEPPGTALSTRESFPILFYASWGMLLLFLGTLAFFVPHSFMVGVRELTETKGFKNLTDQWVLPLLQQFRAGIRRFFKKKKTPKNEAPDAS
jgi:hypothetical protein